MAAAPLKEPMCESNVLLLEKVWNWDKCSLKSISSHVVLHNSFDITRSFQKKFQKNTKASHWFCLWELLFETSTCPRQHQDDATKLVYNTFLSVAGVRRSLFPSDIAKLLVASWIVQEPLCAAALLHPAVGRPPSIHIPLVSLLIKQSHRGDANENLPMKETSLFCS